LPGFPMVAFDFGCCGTGARGSVPGSGCQPTNL
jgi:hypothetical protein